MSDSEKRKSKATVDSSDSDVSESEFRNVAKKPKLDSEKSPPRKSSSSSSSSSSSGSGDEWEGNEDGERKK